MILPIRCYTCGKVLANLTDAWQAYREKYGDDQWQPFFERHRIQRYCCKRVLMAQVPDPNYEKQHALPPSITLSTDRVRNLFLAR